MEKVTLETPWLHFHDEDMPKEGKAVYAKIRKGIRQLCKNALILNKEATEYSRTSLFEINKDIEAILEILGTIMYKNILYTKEFKNIAFYLEHAWDTIRPSLHMQIPQEETYCRSELKKFRLNKKMLVLN